MKQRRKLRICRHRSTITTITAGLAREVCESCARVRLHFVESAVQLHPDEDPGPAGTNSTRAFEAVITFEKPSIRTQCQLCGQSAAYLVPNGLMCEEHAWQAAARIDWTRSDPWVPIPTARSSA